MEERQNSDAPEPLGRMIVAHVLRKYDTEMFAYHYTDLVKILSMARGAFKYAPMLVRCPLTSTIVGDLNGQYADLLRVLQRLGEDAFSPLDDRSYLFLGNYVNYGDRSLETIVLLLLLRCKHPEKVFLLRGTSECQRNTRVHGFLDELKARFNEVDARSLFALFNEVFSYMPLACLVGETIFCCHGGISPMLSALADINKIERPLEDPYSNELARDLMWADPLSGCNGICRNKSAEGSIYFGEDALEDFLIRFDLKLLVRGRQMAVDGRSFFHGRKMVTLFTATSFNSKIANKGAIMVIDEKRVAQFTILEPQPQSNSVSSRRSRTSAAGDRAKLGYVDDGHRDQQSSNGTSAALQQNLNLADYNIHVDPIVISPSAIAKQKKGGKDKEASKRTRTTY